MASLTITIKGPDVADIKRESALGREVAREICNHLEALSTGCAKGTVYVQSGSANPVAASGTLTLDTVIATDVVIVGTITFTGTDTPTTNLHFDTDAGSDALIAVSIAAAINAHPTTSQIVTASAAGDVVTVTAKQRGVVGNFINISSPDTTITAGASHLAGGTGGATDAEATHAFGE